MEDLQSDNQSLHFENSELRQQTEQLLEENALLKKQLEEARREKEEMKKRSGFDVALGSAVSISEPLPREQATNVALTIFTLLSTLLKPSSETSSKELSNSNSILKELDLNSNISLETLKDRLSPEHLETLSTLWKATRKRTPP